MKNLMVLLFFGLIVFVAQLFRAEPKITLIVDKIPVQTGRLIMLENQRKLLKSEVRILVEHNSTGIDSIMKQ